MVSTPYFEEWAATPIRSSISSSTTRCGSGSGRTSSPRSSSSSSPRDGRLLRLVDGRARGPAAPRPDESVRSFSEGKLESLPQVRTGDEIETLAEAFNRMAERIQQQVERLETANRELATLDRMKTDLLANVSHELRTPLAAIRGYVEFIQEGQLDRRPTRREKGSRSA